ncbi:hypothetical protein IM753_08850 [Moraxella sp. K127]|uniref:hypothetical protein n=1 Tax=Moraxella sp. K127 TaxID=2780079 RepID=UPI00187ECDD5|nr:hypothetical protein [Moraxella sp. K127]MBE9591081.1 hypothetical protein [Moraxella sp. K127]
MQKLFITSIITLMATMTYANTTFHKDDLVGTWQCDLLIEQVDGNVTKSQNMTHFFADGRSVGYGETRQIYQGVDIQSVFMSTQDNWDFDGKNLTVNVGNINHVMIYNAISKQREYEKEPEMQALFTEMFRENSPIIQAVTMIDKDNFSYELGAINYGEIKQKTAHCKRLGG